MTAIVALEYHERADAHGRVGGKIPWRQRLELRDGQRGILGRLGLAVREIGSLESAGVVFVLGLVFLVRGLGVGGQRGGGEHDQFRLQASDDLGKERGFGHGKGATRGCGPEYSN